MKAHFPTGSADSVTKEYRFAVVMYGGISLAVYMNGIAQELLSLVRSTALENRKDDQSRMLDDLKSTEAIYRDLAVLLSEEDDSAVHVRFLIDIVSGTSAGGINGIFLAKALTARKDMESLKQTWIKEADFGLLLNDDKGRLEGLPQQVPPRSLLNGERMYVKLFEALAEMMM
jgi:patatin-related protein